MLWEEILEKSPTMKQIFQDKVQEEINKKQVEIDGLKVRLNQAETDNLTSLMALTEIYEMILGGL